MYVYMYTQIYMTYDMNDTQQHGTNKHDDKHWAYKYGVASISRLL